MAQQANLPRIDLPRGWPKRVKSAMLGIIALGQCGNAYRRAPNPTVNGVAARFTRL